jgi:DNA helicase-2/ATP-dependent DNA helicase PcrA
LDAQEFISLVVSVRGPKRKPNAQQENCITAVTGTPQLIVAGPGSGKTTVLVLRALRHVLVDEIPPENIVITTFTRKAAKEIRTRLIEWGQPIIAEALAEKASKLTAKYRAFLESVDINRFLTGTLDSLCEEILADERGPNERQPTVIEAFAANQMLSRRGDIWAESEKLGDKFKDYLSRYTLTGDPPLTLGDMTRVVRTLVDRFIQDEVDIKKYIGPGQFLPARKAVANIFERYCKYLAETNQMDFAVLERVFTQRIESDAIPEKLVKLRAILIDEYQDTNPLQERIYLSLAKASKASVTVVGDDDQSLYRFRGATIELFRDFVKRAQVALGGPKPDIRYLVANYRSTPAIVEFFNAFVRNDPDFVPARIHPPKPSIAHTQPHNGIPVLGMFRDSAEELAHDLAEFLHKVFRAGGRPADKQIPEPIRANEKDGDLGDAVLLASTVNEFKRPFMGQPAKPRFPTFLRDEMQNRGMACFNPRGRALRDIPEVQLLLGLVLEAIDPSTATAPDGVVIPGMAVTNIARQAFRAWRASARNFTNSKPKKVNGIAFGGVLDRWQMLTRDGKSAATEWPVLDVFYSFLPWVARFQNDPECQVYLEAISRSAAQAATFSAYRSLLLRDNPHRQRSIQGVVRDVLAPVADDLIEVDEDIMPSVPRDRFNLMTIHQAKGLEFPLVIVDVASDFSTNHAKQRFRRFPDKPSAVAVMEDDLAAATPIGSLRTPRTALQRSFEDIIRLYYVSYSRPQNILMLVGCIPSLRYKTTIKNVATFWTAGQNWTWRKTPPVRPPPTLADNLPITLL